MRWCLPLLLLGLGCDEPACGEGWDRARYASEYAEGICTLMEQCQGGNYGGFEGPDHAGCVANAEDYMTEGIAASDADGCSPYESCAAQQDIERLWVAVETCEDFTGTHVNTCPEP